MKKKSFFNLLCFSGSLCASHQFSENPFKNKWIKNAQVTCSRIEQFFLDYANVSKWAPSAHFDVSRCGLESLIKRLKIQRIFFHPILDWRNFSFTLPLTSKKTFSLHQQKKFRFLFFLSQRSKTSANFSGFVWAACLIHEYVSRRDF